MRVKGPLHRELESITAQLRHFYGNARRREAELHEDFAFTKGVDLRLVAKQIERLERILKGFDQ